MPRKRHFSLPWCSWRLRTPNANFRFSLKADCQIWLCAASENHQIKFELIQLMHITAINSPVLMLGCISSMAHCLKLSVKSKGKRLWYVKISSCALVNLNRAVVAFLLKTSSPGLTPQYGKIFALTLLPEMRELCTLNLLTLSLTTANAWVIWDRRLRVITCQCHGTWEWRLRVVC